MNGRTKIFIIIESLIYILLILMDIMGLDSSYVKYAGILLCLVHCMMGKDTYLKAAMFFTAVADFFLLIMDYRYYVIGVVSFIIVQSIYCLYLKKNSCRVYIPLRIVLCILTVAVYFFTDILDPLSFAASIYFPNLVLNFISSLSADLKLYSLGMFLFIMCDVCVGLHNLLSPGKFYEIASFLMWVFYLPSQVLISIHKDK